MSNILNRDDYINLYLLNEISSVTLEDTNLLEILKKNGCINLTVCPECNINNFFHADNCSIYDEVENELIEAKSKEIN